MLFLFNFLIISYRTWAALHRVSLSLHNLKSSKQLIRAGPWFPLCLMSFTPFRLVSLRVELSRIPLCQSESWFIWNPILNFNIWLCSFSHLCIFKIRSTRNLFDFKGKFALGWLTISLKYLFPYCGVFILVLFAKNQPIIITIILFLRLSCIEFIYVLIQLLNLIKSRIIQIIDHIRCIFLLT